MINWIKGAKVHNDELITEGYRIDDGSVTSVVNAEKIIKLMFSFIDAHNEKRFFLFLEVPCTKEEEDMLADTGGALHKNLYYLDDIGGETVRELLNTFADILVNDGLSSFGVGTKESEIGKYKYNTVVTYSHDIDIIKTIFDKNEIPQKVDLLTPWDTFDKNNPGISSAYKDENDRGIYDIVDVLSQVGLYKAKTIEE